MTTNATFKPTIPQKRALEAMLKAERGEPQECWMKHGEWFTETRIRGTVTTTTIDKLRKAGMLVSHEEQPWRFHRLTDAGRAYLNAASADVEANAEPEPFAKDTRVYHTRLKMRGRVHDYAPEAEAYEVIPDLLGEPGHERDMDFWAAELTVAESEAPEPPDAVAIMGELMGVMGFHRVSPAPEPPAPQDAADALDVITIEINQRDYEALQAENARLKAENDALQDDKARLLAAYDTLERHRNILHSLVKAIADRDADSLAPIPALTLVYEWKRAANTAIERTPYEID